MDYAAALVINKPKQSSCEKEYMKSQGMKSRQPRNGCNDIKTMVTYLSQLTTMWLGLSKGEIFWKVPTYFIISTSLHHRN